MSTESIGGAIVGPKKDGPLFRAFLLVLVFAIPFAFMGLMLVVATSPPPRADAGAEAPVPSLEE